MLNFAEQTGSGAVIVVWSALLKKDVKIFLKETVKFGRSVQQRKNFGNSTVII